jgi:DNA invertase Pin-like site-specific DNA recombinase
VYTLDRFSRNRYDSAHYKHILKKNGVKVLSAKENISNDPSGILMETMLEGMAEYYSAELAQKVKRGMHESFLKGHSLGSACYGYSTVAVEPENKASKAKRLVINDKEANIVRLLFQSYADGMTTTEILNDFKIKGIVNRRGKPFHKQSVVDILSNKKYIGVLTLKGEENVGAIPAVIDQDTFDQVQVKLQKNKRCHSDFKAVEKYLLSGKLYCGYCKHHIIADSTNKADGRIYRYYKCFNIKNGNKKCEKTVVPKRWLEDYVVTMTMKLLKQDGMIDRITTQLINYDQKCVDNENLPYLEKQLKDTQRKIDNYLHAIEEGIITADTKTKMLELESTKADLMFRIDEEKLNMPIKLVYDEVK